MLPRAKQIIKRFDIDGFIDVTYEHSMLCVMFYSETPFFTDEEMPQKVKELRDKLKMDLGVPVRIRYLFKIGENR